MNDGSSVSSNDVYHAGQRVPWHTSTLSEFRWLTDALTERQRNDFFQRYWKCVEAGIMPTTEQAEQLVAIAYAGPGTDVIPYEPARETDEQVVYYLRLKDLCKIGTTGNLATRLRALRHDEVLVTERGGYALERTRHRQFEHLRREGEWFDYEGSLRDHVEGLQLGISQPIA